MSTHSDVIELGSSDEDAEPTPKKQKIVPNAMVRIPNCNSKLPGLTIKPAKIPMNSKILIKNSKALPKPVTNLNTKNVNVSPHIKYTRMPTKTGNVIRKFNKTLVSNHHLQSSLTSPKKAILAKAEELKLLKNLPSSITVKVASGSPKVCNVRSLAMKPKRFKNPFPHIVQTVELDDEPAVTSQPPQWYQTPEQQAEVQLAKEDEQNSLEEANNKEPVKFIEITIEDSPIKTVSNQQIDNRTDQLQSITIEDSPVKTAIDINPLQPKKDKQSKKKLGYTSVQVVQDGMLEIEINPIDINESTIQHTEECNEAPVSNTIKEPLAEKNTNIDSQKEKTENIKNSITNDKIDGSSNEFNDVYQKFIETCFHFENSKDMEQIVEKKIKSYYRQCPKDYVDSEEFNDLVSGKILAIQTRPDNLYLYIKDVVEELKLQKKLAKATVVNDVEQKSDSKVNELDISECDSKRQKQIQKLENTLKKLHRAIQKLEEQEVDFDDEEDSVYLLTERYKDRVIRVHAKLCQLTHTKMPSEPSIKLDTLPGQPTGPARKLEKWINKKVSIGKPLPFPDFHDVLRCVREANEEDKLGWNDVQILAEARELFTACGKKLKRRRQENEWRIAASRLPTLEDPAECDVALKKRLDENKILAIKREADILNKYVDRQNQLKLEPEEIGDKEAEESPVESEDEDENEDSNAIKAVKNVTNQSEEPKQDKEGITNAASNKNDAEKPPKDDCEKPAEVHSISDDDQADDLNLLERIYSESDSVSTINPSDSDHNSDSAKNSAQDVISIEDSSYSDSEICDTPVNKGKDDCDNKSIEISADAELSVEIEVMDVQKEVCKEKDVSETNTISSESITPGHSQNKDVEIDVNKKINEDKENIHEEENRSASPNVIKEDIDETPMREETNCLDSPLDINDDKVNETKATDETIPLAVETIESDTVEKVVLASSGDDTNKSAKLENGSTYNNDIDREPMISDNLSVEKEAGPFKEVFTELALMHSNDKIVMNEENSCKDSEEVGKAQESETNKQTVDSVSDCKISNDTQNTNSDRITT